MRWSKAWVPVVMCALLPGTACELGGSDCTDMGCVDAASLLIGSDAAWPVGAYRLEVTLDESSGSVDFRIPEDLPERGSVSYLTGSNDIEVGLQQVAECTSVRQGDAVSQSCQPVPERYELTLNQHGTPAHFAVTLSRDGETLLDESGTISYTESRPNCPECGPVCRQGQVDLVF